MAERNSKTPRNLVTEFADNVNTRSGSSLERHQSVTQSPSHGNDGEDPRRSARILQKESPKKSEVKSTDRAYPGSSRKSQSRRSIRTPVQTMPLTSGDGRSASKSFVVGPDHLDIDTPRSNIEGLLAVADTQPHASHLEGKTSRRLVTTPEVEKTFKIPPSSSKGLRNVVPNPNVPEESTPGSKYTPRTNIWNLLHIVQAAEQTPVEKSSDLSFHHTRRSHPSITKQKGWGQEVTLSPSVLSRTSETQEDSLSFGRRKSVKRTRRSFHISIPEGSFSDEEDSSQDVDGEKVATDSVQRSVDKNVKDESVETNNASVLDEDIEYNRNDSSQNVGITDVHETVNDAVLQNEFDNRKRIADRDEKGTLAEKMATDQYNKIEDNESINNEGEGLPDVLERAGSVAAGSNLDLIPGTEDESMDDQPQQDGNGHPVDTGNNLPFSELRGNSVAEATSEINEGADELPETLSAYSRPSRQEFIVSKSMSEARVLEEGESIADGLSGVSHPLALSNAGDTEHDLGGMKGGDESDLTMPRPSEEVLPAELEIIGANVSAVNLSSVLNLNEMAQGEEQTENDLEANDILLSIRLEKASATSPRDSLKHSTGVPGTPNRSVYDLSEGSSSSADLELFEARSPKNLSKSKRWPSGSQSAEKTPQSAGKSTSRSGKHRADLSLTNSSSKRPRLSYSEWKSLQMEKGEGKTTPRYPRAPRSSTPRDRAKQILHSTKLRLQTSILSHISQDLPDMSMETSTVGHIAGISPIRPDTRTQKQMGAENQQRNTVDGKSGGEYDSVHLKGGESQTKKHSSRTQEDSESSEDDLPKGISPMRTPHIDMNKRPRATTIQKKAQRRSFIHTPSRPAAPRQTQKKARKGDKQPAKKSQKLPSTAMARSSVKFFAQRHTSMKLSKDAIEEIEKVSEIFWDDSFKALEAYAQHGGRKTVNEQDVILLMKTQRLINGTEDLHDKIRELLPMGLRAELIPKAKP